MVTSMLLSEIHYCRAADENIASHQISVKSVCVVLLPEARCIRFRVSYCVAENGKRISEIAENLIGIFENLAGRMKYICRFLLNCRDCSGAIREAIAVSTSIWAT